jgi:5'-deoxy-5'-methylthioadenosine phosphorylase
MSENTSVKPDIAIIGGSGFYDFPDMMNCEQRSIDTPYSAVVEVTIGRVEHKSVVFIPRHGSEHRLPPHKINYRANIWALKSIGVSKIIALNAVGGIDSSMPPGAFVLPNQLVDYTYGREHTFADTLSDQLNHIDFTQPFSEIVRCTLSSAMTSSNICFSSNAVYACTQGPRLETAAEVNRLERDGCNIVGMTAMPEAALAKELNLEYAMLCTVVNWAAGRAKGDISLEQIHQILADACPSLRQTLIAAIRLL